MLNIPCRFWLRLVLLTISLLQFPSNNHAQSTEDPESRPEQSANLSRSAFLKRIAKVKAGMSEEDVRTILGPPEAIRPHEPDASTVRWCYGIGKRSGFPTLGQVWFRCPEPTPTDSKPGLKVSWVVGSQGKPPSESVLPENRLRHLLDVLGTLDALSPVAVRDTFDPLAFIGAANTLLPEGKTRILAVMGEYRRLHPFPPDNVILLTRILFDSPASRARLPQFSRDRDGPPALRNEETSVPWIPIIIVKDVPLMVEDLDRRREGIHTGPDVGPFFNALAKHGQLRSLPLHPTERPLDLLAGGRLAPELNAGSYRSSVPALMHQLLRLIRSVNPRVREFLRWPEQHDVPLRSDQWQQFRTEETRRPVRWDPTIGDYREEPFRQA
jgi:hypothetical protein